MSNIISRKTAKESNLVRYFTGKPCKHGHISERITSNGTCLECAKTHSQTFRISNPNARQQHYNNNKTHILNYGVLYRKSNKQTIQQYKKQYYQNNKHKYSLWNSQRRARKRAQNLNLTKAEKIQVSDLYYKAQCYSQVEQYNFVVDHITPLALGGTDHPDNLQILEAGLNGEKGSRHPDSLDQKYLNGVRCSV